ncbi:MAG TPA: hypothetical protein PKD61_38690 [Polyangiaceae bacterium]|nr:hypothetical protein [Polyangiaceae bacterium]
MADGETGGEPRSIRIDGTVRAVSQPVESSVTGWKAAAIHYSASYNKRETDSSGRSTTRRVHLGTADVSGDLIIDTQQGVIRAAAGSFIFDVGQIEDVPLPSTGRLPPELEAKTGGQLEAWLVGERALNVGDPVELVGTVRPSADPICAFEVVPQTGTRIRDRSLDDMADDLEAMGVDPKAKGRVAMIVMGVAFGIVLLALASVVFNLAS